MTTFHDSLCYSGGIDRRVTCRYEEYSDKESGFLCTDKKVYLVFCRKDSLKHETNLIAKALFTPFCTIIGCLKHRFTGVPVSELVICDLIRMDINSSVSPFMVKKLPGHRCLGYPQALVDNRFSALLAKKSATAASSKSMTLKYSFDFSRIIRTFATLEIQLLAIR